MEQKLKELQERTKELAGLAKQVSVQSSNLTAEAVKEEDYHEIMNLMGRYAAYHYYAEHINTYHFFALDDERTSAELGSTGVYKGCDKLYQMFAIYHNYNNFKCTAHMHPLNTPYIHVAGDGETAKGYWHTNGLEVLPSPPGRPPLSIWFYDAYSMNFIKVNGQWKWLNFHLVDDIKAPFQVSWTIANKEPNKGPDGLVPPTYTTESFQPYNAKRLPNIGCDIPAPYEHFE